MCGKRSKILEHADNCQIFAWHIPDVAWYTDIRYTPNLCSTLTVYYFYIGLTNKNVQENWESVELLSSISEDAPAKSSRFFPHFCHADEHAS